MKKIKKVKKARVSWTRGRRDMTTLMSQVGLGVSNVGIREVITLTYDEDTDVTEARVMKAVREMIRLADEDQAEFVISNPRFIDITEHEE